MNGWKERERRIEIPMPWKSNAWCINRDELLRGRPVFLIIWAFYLGAFKLRAGWYHRWDHG